LAATIRRRQQFKRVAAAGLALYELSGLMSALERRRLDHGAAPTHHGQGPVMPQKTWTAKRKRQYAHIKDSLLEQGKPQPLAEEIAARVVNKERAQHGESVTASASSINDLSAGRRGGLRSHQGPGGRTLLQLRNEARQRGLKGRSSMNKAQLGAALSR
jgi:hypothetical protein